MLIAGSKFSGAQNLLPNSDFEINGQPRCDGWYNDCGHELTYMCNGLFDSSCVSANWFIKQYQDAPAGGGQWCMKLTDPGGYVLSMQTTLTGQFLGVCETKVWFRPHAYGARGGAILYFKKGNLYTGMGGGYGTGNSNLGWTQTTFRDTIHSLSDSIIIKLVANETSPSLPGKDVYIDLPEFRMLEWWTDVSEPNENARVSLFPNPFSHQLSFSVANNEPTIVFLYNFMGQQVLQQTFANTTTINTGQLVNGVYFYELRNDKGVIKTGKVVKE